MCSESIQPKSITCRNLYAWKKVSWDPLKFSSTESCWRSQCEAGSRSNLNTFILAFYVYPFTQISFPENTICLKLVNNNEQPKQSIIPSGAVYRWENYYCFAFFTCHQGQCFQFLATEQCLKYFNWINYFPTVSLDALYRTSLQSLWIYNTKISAFVKEPSAILWRSRHGSNKSLIANSFHRVQGNGIYCLDKAESKHISATIYYIKKSFGVSVRECYLYFAYYKINIFLNTTYPKNKIPLKIPKYIDHA